MVTHQILIEKDPDRVTVSAYDEKGALISEHIAGPLSSKAITDAAVFGISAPSTNAATNDAA